MGPGFVSRSPLLEACCHFSKRSDPRQGSFHHEAITAVTALFGTPYRFREFGLLLANVGAAGQMDEQEQGGGVQSPPELPSEKVQLSRKLLLGKFRGRRPITFFVFFFVIFTSPYSHPKPSTEAPHPIGSAGVMRTHRESRNRRCQRTSLRAA